jgi:hypothetical protein
MHNTVATLSACRGRYVALLEGDDYWTDPAKLKKQVAIMEARRNCVISGHRVRFLDEREHRKCEAQCTPDLKPVAGLSDVLGGYYVQTCSMVIRRSAIPVWPEWFYGMKCADSCIQILCCQRGDILFTNEPMAVYRIHGGGVWSGARFSANLLARLELYQAVRQHFGPEHHKVIDSQIVETLERLCVVYQGEGDLRSARKYMLQSAIARVRAMKSPGRSLTMALNLGRSHVGRWRGHGAGRAGQFPAK